MPKKKKRKKRRRKEKKWIIKRRGEQTLALMDSRVVHTNDPAIKVVHGGNQEGAPAVVGVRVNGLGGKVRLFVQHVLGNLSALVKRGAESSSSSSTVSHQPKNQKKAGEKKGRN